MTNIKIKKIALNFLIPGHTKFGPDRHFGIARKLYKNSDIETFEEICELIAKSS